LHRNRIRDSVGIGNWQSKTRGLAGYLDGKFNNDPNLFDSVRYLVSENVTKPRWPSGSACPKSMRIKPKTIEIARPDSFESKTSSTFRWKESSQSPPPHVTNRPFNQTPGSEPA
jgi:hypothetical protein